jgi:hypothetical protein
MINENNESKPVSNAINPMILSFLKWYQRMNPVMLEKKSKITKISTTDPQILVYIQLPRILAL